MRNSLLVRTACIAAALTLMVSCRHRITKGDIVTFDDLRAFDEAHVPLQAPTGTSVGGGGGPSEDLDTEDSRNPSIEADSAAWLESVMGWSAGSPATRVVNALKPERPNTRRQAFPTCTCEAESHKGTEFWVVS